MALTYPGGYITKSPPTPTSTSAPGIWTMDQALQYIKAGTWPVPSVGDPYWANVSLLSGTGSTNGAQNNTFLDSSSNNFTITRNGNTTQGTFTPFSGPNGYWGNYFNAANLDSISFANGFNFAPGTGDYTIEFWINGPLNSDRLILDFRSGGGGNGFAIVTGSGSGNTAGCLRYSGANDATSGSVVITNNQWNHCAVVRASGTINLYVNGVYVGTCSDSTNYSSTSGTIYIGRSSYSTSYNLTANLSNLRIVKGTALYTTNFTPSTTPLTAVSGTSLLTCQSNRFVDNSGNSVSLTISGSPSVLPFAPFGNTSMYSTTSVGGSGYFDGSSDYLSLTPSSSTSFGTGDWSFDCWCYTGTNPTYQMFWGYDAVNNYFALLNSGGVLIPHAYDGANSHNGSTSYPVPLNAWAHMMISKQSGVLRLTVNGTLVYSATNNVSYGASTGSFWVGASANYPSQHFFNGYIANARFLKGGVAFSISSTTVGDSVFSVPTAPSTAIANTQLLLNFTNAGIYDQAAGNDFETVGNAQVSTSVVKYGSGSMYFDGVGDRLYRENSPLYNFDSGDFTVECWVYVAANTSYATLIDFSNDGGGGYGWMLEYSATRGVLFYMGTGGGNSNISYSFTPPLTTWTHVAVTRAGGYAKIFINGNQVAAASLTSSSVSTNPLVIGSSKNGTYPFNGYLSDVRITKGLARYTYNFTPPTRAFGAFFQAAATPTADPYFDYTTLLLPGSGTNGAQNNTFLDSSTNAFSITRNGNTTQGTFSPFSVAATAWSNYFDGNGDYLSFADSANWYFTGDFTVECWVFLTSTASSEANVIAQHRPGDSANQAVEIFISGTECYFVYNTSVVSAIMPANQWVHLAFSCTSGTASGYINGIRIGTFTMPSRIDSVDPLTIGARTGSGGSGATGYFPGYISNVRVVKGTGLYTGATVTVPTEPLTAVANTVLLTCQSNRFIDTNTQVAAKTATVYGNTSVQAFSPFAPTAAYSAATNGGSGYFDGTGDYLTVPAGTAFALDGAYTMELWFYPNALSGFVGLLCGSQSNAIWLYLSNSTGNILFGYNGADQISTSSAPVIGQWNHIAVSRNGSNVTSVYLNGTRIGTATLSTSYASSSGTFDIGRVSTNTNANGYFSGARVVKGTAVYDPSQTTLTVPTAPPTAITNTSLLLNFTNAGITDATAKNDLETVGNAQISNTTAKFGSTSMKFDGTGDWLIGYQNALYDMGSGDFTVEFWVNTTTASSSACLVGATTGGGPSNTQWGIFQGYTSSTSIDIYLSNGSSYFANTGGGSVTDGNWHHVAFTRYGSSGKLFLDGLQVGSTLSLSTTSLAPANKPIYVGSQGGSFPFTGYIQDLRITKGIARYTQPFTPPTAAFQLL